MMEVVHAEKYRLELEYEAPLLRARIIGGHDTSLSVSREYWIRILREAREADARQLLVLDGMQGEVLDDDDLRSLCEVLVLSSLKSVRIAYVEGRADQIPRAERAELMARDLGFTVRVFNNQSDAELWLRHGMH